MPVFLTELQNELPVSPQSFDISGKKAGLVVVDIINGFATVGAGPLAPPSPNAQVDRMIEETDRLARRMLDEGHPVLVFLDTHEMGKPELPYPPHCEVGSGQEELVPALKWLENEPGVTLMEKDCIDGFIGGIDPETGTNTVLEWINKNGLETVLVAGICTDICVMDFVLTLLSARNHGLTEKLSDIVVVEKACATYDFPVSAAARLGLPPTTVHPQTETHHLGLYFMAGRGAVIASDIQF